MLEWTPSHRITDIVSFELQIPNEYKILVYDESSAILKYMAPEVKQEMKIKFIGHSKDLAGPDDVSGKGKESR